MKHLLLVAVLFIGCGQERERTPSPDNSADVSIVHSQPVRTPADSLFMLLEQAVQIAYHHQDYGTAATLSFLQAAIIYNRQGEMAQVIEDWQKEQGPAITQRIKPFRRAK